MPPQSHAAATALVESLRQQLQQAEAALNGLDATTSASPAALSSPYEAAFFNSPLVMAVMARNSLRFLSVNHAFETTFGVPEQRALGSTPLSLGMLSAAQWHALPDLYRDTQSIRDLELVVKDLYGRNRELLVSCELVQWQGEEAFLVTGMEMTISNQALKQLGIARYALDHAKDAAFWIDPVTSRFIDINAAAAQSLGYSHEELLALAVPDIDPDYPLHTLHDFWSRLSENDPVRFHTWHHRKDGSKFPVEITAHYARSYEPPFLFALARNTSDRSQAATSLMRSETRYLAVVQHMHTGLAVCEPVGDDCSDFIITEINPAGLALAGRSREEILGGSLLKNLPFLKESGVFDLLRSVALTGEPLRQASCIAGPGEGSRWVMDSIYRLPTGEVVSIFDDITRDMDSHRQLEASELRYRELVSRMTAAVISCQLQADGGQCICTSWNPEAERLLGVPAATAVGQPMASLLSAADSAALLPCIVAAHSTGCDQSVAAYSATCVGERRWVSGTVFSLSSGDVVIMLENVTEHHRAAEAMRESKELAEEANRAKSEFLANMSHEIRTPLNGILGMLQVLQLSDLPSDLHQLTSVASDSGLRLLQILNDLLDLSRIEANRMECRQEPFAPRLMCNALMDIFSHEARAKGLLLQYSISPRLPDVCIGDETRIRQILFNVLGNAVKFTEQGTVTFTVDVVGAVAPGQPITLLLTVEDSGPGIAPDMLDAVFAPFTQGDGSLRRKYGGVGLGLTIVKRIVKLLGGTLCMESVMQNQQPQANGATLQHGTFVHCILPLQCSEDVGVLGHGFCTPQLGLGKRVLLVEDDAINRLTISRLVEALGHHVHAVASGEAALDVMAAMDARCLERDAAGSEKDPEDCYDVILMDIQMPGLDGVETMLRIRERHPDLIGSMAFVALTAHAMAGDRERFLNSGFSHYLPKPLQLEELAAVLAACARS